MALTWGALLWLAILLLAPLTARAGEAPLFYASVYRTAAAVCHQRPERSFDLAGVPLPVCARCIGLYASGALTAAAAWIGGATVPRRARAILILAAAPTAITVLLEWTGLAFPSNTARAIAAVPLGAAAGWIFVRMLRADAADAATCAMIR